MTEAEWLACERIDLILDFLDDERRFRLFAVACCRDWHLDRRPEPPLWRWQSSLLMVTRPRKS